MKVIICLESIFLYFYENTIRIKINEAFYFSIYEHMKKKLRIIFLKLIINKYETMYMQCTFSGMDF